MTSPPLAVSLRNCSAAWARASLLLRASSDSRRNPAASSAALLASKQAEGEPKRSINMAALREPTPATKVRAIQSSGEFCGAFCIKVSSRLSKLQKLHDHAFTTCARLYRFSIFSQAKLGAAPLSCDR